MSRVLTRETLIEIFKCYEHLPEREDAEVTILKGHLLIESRLIEYIDFKLVNPGVFKSGKFKFSQLLMIARSLCESNLHANLWQSIDNLNHLRNKLAHSLESDEYETAINRFLDFHYSRFFKNQNKEYRALHESIISLYSSLVHLIAETT